MKINQGRATPPSRTKAVCRRTFDFRRRSQEMLESGTSVQIIDTRPKHYTTKAQDIMEGAVWRDPDAWMTGLAPFKDRARRTFSVSTASTSDVRRLQRCVRPGSMAGTCQADILPGRQSRVR